MTPPSSASRWPKRHVSADHGIRKGVWRSYVAAQLIGTCKTALWWACVGLLSIVLLDSVCGLAATRCAFNVALLLASPLAIQAAEKRDIRQLLLSTTMARCVIWTVAVPCTFFVWRYLIREESAEGMPPGTRLNKFVWCYWLALGLLMFADGVAAAFANSVDIDCGGLDSLGAKYSLVLTDFIRYRYTTLHQTFFDSAFLLFVAPTVTALAYLAHQPWTSLIYHPDQSQKSKGFFVMGVSIVFGVVSTLTYQVYAKGLPRNANVFRAHGAASPLQQDYEPQNTGITYRNRFTEILDGMVIVMGNKGLQWRLTFLALETALEDTIVSVVIPITALYLAQPFFGSSDIMLIAVVTCVCIGVAKLGGVLASTMVMPTMMGETDVRKLFRFIIFGGLSLTLLPLGMWISGAQLVTRVLEMEGVSDEGVLHHYDSVVGGALVLTGLFLFFFVSTVPKIGFTALIQSCIALVGEEAPAVFAFIGIFVTVTDGLAIVALCCLLAWTGPKPHAYTLGGLVAAHLCNCFWQYRNGPRLIAVRSMFGRSP